jgi:hypothetical protein
MSTRTRRWLIDISLITAAVCLFLRTYVTDAQYGRAHGEAERFLDEARRSAGTNYDRYNEAIADYNRDHESPKFYCRQRETWGRITVAFFLFPAVAGLMYRRWAAAKGDIVSLITGPGVRQRSHPGLRSSKLRFVDG